MPPTEITTFLTPSRVMPRRVVKRRGTTRERTGCLTCRQRKKRCDLGHPICKGCARLNYHCQWEVPRPVPGHAQDNSSGLSQPLAPTAHVPFRLLQNPDPILFWVDEHADCASLSSRRHLLRYYTQTFTILLTSNVENNCFLSVFLPMAMHSPPLMTALIAWSASHLALRDPSFQQVAMQNRCAALRDLQGVFNSDRASIEIPLAISLVLCSLESIMADNSHAWYLHLMGAAGIIASRLDPSELSGDSEHITLRLRQQFEDTYAGRWLLRNFAYRDIVMSVARGRAPLLSSYQFLRLDDPQLPDSHFGLASEILEILSLTSMLQAEIRGCRPRVPTEEKYDQGEPDDTHRGTQIPAKVGANLASLESRLCQWTCPSSPDMSLKLLAESYRSSALIHLYRVMHSAFPGRTKELSEKMMGQVAVIVRSVEQMPLRSLPECTLLFPLFLAGGEATEESHIQSIRNRMRDLVQSRSFRNVDVALSVLEKLWRSRTGETSADPGVRIDWLEIIQQDGVDLCLT